VPLSRGRCTDELQKRRRTDISFRSRRRAAVSARLSALQPPLHRGSIYFKVLEWSFAFFNASRFLSYLPTFWAIHASGDSSQHSLLTWLCWLGANATMAAWLYECNGRRFNAAIAVNSSNTLMCLLACVLICAYRL
jgi:hypothetical protein